MARLLEFGPRFLISLNTKTVALIIWTPWSVVNIESLASLAAGFEVCRNHRVLLQLEIFFKELKQVKDFRDIKGGIKHTQHVHLKIV